MKTFKDFDDADSVVTPVDIEQLAKGRVAHRVRRQRAIAAGVSAFAIVIISGVAFASTTTGSGGVKTINNGKRQVPTVSDPSTSESQSSVVTDDSVDSVDSQTSTTFDDHGSDDDQFDDDSVDSQTSTTFDDHGGDDDSSDDNSGHGGDSDNSGKGSNN